MSQDFFRIERGLELDELVQYLQGSGVPGLGGDTDAALVGSVYTDNATGSLYTKISAGTGTNRWQKMASESYVNNAVGSTVSWREPVVVRDNVSTTILTGTATAPITIDGVSVTDGQRVLFSALTGGGGKNIYIYQQATGTFVEDINQESTGDATYVQGGTGAGKTFVYNGTDWVLTDQTSLDEDGYIRAFIGKGAVGSEVPVYATNNFVAAASNLEAAIGALDTEIGANVSNGNVIASANKINANIQALDSKLGANVTAGNHLNPANTVSQSLMALDTQLGANLGVGNFYAADAAISTAITALDSELGPNVADGNYVLAANKINQNITALDTAVGHSVTSVGVIVSTNSANQNIQALGAELNKVTQQSTQLNVTSSIIVDSVTAGSAKWLVRAELVSDVSRVYSTEVYALGNGTSSDYTRYATLRIGTAIPGLSVTVDNAAGVLQLKVASTGAVNVTARRVGTVA
jgi:hypothetical protein